VAAQPPYPFGVIGLGKGGLSPGLLQIQERDERKNRGGENCLSYLRRKTNKGRNRGKEERKERKTEKKKTDENQSEG